MANVDLHGTPEDDSKNLPLWKCFLGQRVYVYDLLTCVSYLRVPAAR